MEPQLFRGYYERYDGPPKKFVLPPPIWWNMQFPGSPEFSFEEAFMHGSVWPMLVDGYSREEGIS